MSKSYQTPSTLHSSHLGFLVKALHALLIVLASGSLCVVPMSAQSVAGSNTNTGTIAGTVTDVGDDPVAAATVVLQGPVTRDRRTATTGDDGSFAFDRVTQGTTYQITVTAEGFAEWSSSVAVAPGQTKSVSDVKLRIETVQRAITVGYSPKEIAVQQLKAQEQQRVLGFIPNIYVTYERHPEPLTAKMKFHLAYKGLTHPTYFSWMAAWSGIQQAANTPDYPQGAEGYGKRLGANLAGGVSEALIGNAILPSLLHQDPRYFYRGDGSTKSRLAHAMLAPFVCPGDNGHLQPNYSTWGGALISNAIATTYLPSSNRTASHVFGSFAIGTGSHVALGVAQEFILAKFTHRRKQHD